MPAHPSPLHPPAFVNTAAQHIFSFRYEGPPAPLRAYLLERYGPGRDAAWGASFYPQRVRLNDAAVSDGTWVQPGDRVSYLHLRADEPALPALPPPLHVDPWLLAVAKADDAPVSPSGVYYFTALAVRAREAYANGELTPLHRLDLETSGPVLFARHRKDLKRWHGLFRRKTLHKRYRALVHGAYPAHLRVIAGRIVPAQGSAIHTKLALEPMAADDPAVLAAAHPRGKSAPAEVSLTRVLAVQPLVTPEGGVFSDLVLEPVTGKTNQLRVHLAHVGHPIVGDKKYHPDEAVFLDWFAHRDFSRIRDALLLPRQALHCEALRFTHPFTGAPVTISAPAAMWRRKVAPLPLQVAPAGAVQAAVG